MNELQRLIDQGVTRYELTAMLIDRYGLRPAFARFIADIALGVIKGDVIEVPRQSD